MLRARECASFLALALFALTGCVRVVNVPPPMPRPNPPAVLSQLALVVPITDTTMPYVSVPWHRARLTIGRHDGSMAEITHTFESTRTGLRSVGHFPTLPPGPGYWIRVELVQSVPDGTERIVGRGWAGDEDEDGISFISGGNLARLNIKPTMIGQQIALAPVRPPRIDDGDWRPTWRNDDFDAPVQPAVVDLLPRDEGAAAPVYDYDDRKRERYELDYGEPDPEEVLDEVLEEDSTDEPAEAAAFAEPPAIDEDDDAYEESDDYGAPASDNEADVPTGDVLESFSAIQGNR